MTAAPTNATTCARCGSTDNPRPLPKRYRCSLCGTKPLCYGCDTSHNVWCPQ